MNAERLRKMFTSGDNEQVHKACAELSDAIVKLERDVAALEAQPIPQQQTRYRVVEKGRDDPMCN